MDDMESISADGISHPATTNSARGSSDEPMDWYSSDIDSEDADSEDSDNEVDLYTFERIIEDFISGELSWLPSHQHQRAVELFAESQPWDFTFYQQVALHDHFKSCHYNKQLPLDLADTFHHNLRTGWPEEDTPSAEDNDTSVQRGNGSTSTDNEDPPADILPFWLTETIFLGRPSPIPLLYFQTTAQDDTGSTKLTALHDRRSDAFHMLKGLKTFHIKIKQWVLDINTENGASPLRMEVLALLDQNSTDLRCVRLPQEATLRAEDWFEYWIQLGQAENFLYRVKESCFMAEAYLATYEAQLTETPSGRGMRITYWSHRDALAGVIASLRTEWLRIFFLPSWMKRRLFHRQHNGDDLCSICHDDLPKKGDTATLLAVTYQCCSRPFHTHCLLRWLLDQPPQVNCPMCRSLVELKFLRELMEMELRRM